MFCMCFVGLFDSSAFGGLTQCHLTRKTVAEALKVRRP